MLLEKKIPFSYILNKIRTDIVYIIVIAVFFYLLKYFFLEYLPAIPLAMVSIVGTAISLILAFRINQSYDRWWEARKVWGAIVNDSRTLVLQLASFIREADLQREEIKQVYIRIAHRQIAWCYCLGQSLRKSDPLANMGHLIGPEELTSIAQHSNKPNALLRQHTSDLKILVAENIIDSIQQVQLDNTILRLCESMGKCERINNTVFPRTYSLIVHFFIYMFTVMLSLSLVESVGLYELPILTVIASAFLLIERTGIEMQDPFRGRPTDTAVTSIARTIEINIRQMLGEQEIPAPYEPDGFYQL